MGYFLALYSLLLFYSIIESYSLIVVSSLTGAKRPERSSNVKIILVTFDETFSIIKEFLPLLTAGAVAVSAAGFVPRMGPGRAIWVALRSRFAFKPATESLRLAEINLVKSKIADKDFRQGYLVVTGENGVGKTCLLDTVTSKTAGVIFVAAYPKDNEYTIIKKTLQRLTRIHFDFIPPFHSARRVVFWYRLFTLGRAPIIVINATECRVGQEYAALTGAVRTLVDEYKLRVVVDSSPNSFDETLVRTIRQSVIDIKAMTKEKIWQIEQLQDLFEYVKEADLDDTVFAVLGGIPARYEELWRNAKTDLMNGQDPRRVIGAHLCAEIYAAIKLVTDAQDSEEFIKLFDNKNNIIPNHIWKHKKLKRPTPDVFREVKRDGIPVLIPASNSIGIVLHNSLMKEPSLNELEELFKT